MKKGTKIGWIMIALSIVLSVWVIVSQSSKAVNSQYENAGFNIDDNGVLLSYTGTSTSLQGGSNYDTGSIPGDVTTIGTGFLSNNGNVTRVELPSTVTTLQSGAFSGSYVQSLSMSGVTAIPADAFKESYSLSSVTLSDSVISIGGQAFYGTPITNITIPAYVSSIATGTGANGAFDGATDLTSINVASGNYNYFSDGGCLYSVGGRLLVVPQGFTDDTLTLPGSATGISAYAFDGAYNVKNVDLPSNVSSIDSNAFTNSSVEKLTVRNRSISLNSSMDLPYDAVIEGYLGSTAQTFADNNGYTFMPLDGSNTIDNNNSNNNANTNTGSAIDPNANTGSAIDPNANNNGNNGNNNANTNNGNTNNNTNTGSNTTPVTPVNPSNNNNTNGGGSTAPHTADNTPKTADGDLDPRFVIALAVFAAGLATIILSRRQRAVLVQKAGNSRLDD